MCGIFGFALRKPVNVAKVFRVLAHLEAHQYTYESKPVGGYGAGIAILDERNEVNFEKVGKVDHSPARRLAEIVTVKAASVLVGHVRMPSPEFMETAHFKETAQPYVARCFPDLTVVSLHNGKIENYVEARKKLGKIHTFESEKVGLIDSEVIPHYFEESARRKHSPEEALDALYANIEGTAALSLLHVQGGDAFLHFIHKGKTRGLHVWTNKQGEVVFCSRTEPLAGEFDDLLAAGKFEEKVSVAYHEEASVKLSFPVDLLKE